MLIHREFVFRMIQLWYDDPMPLEGLDIAVFNHAPEPLPGIRWEEKMTLILDLTQTEEALFQDIRKQERAKIRNARDQDGIRCTLVRFPSAGLRAEFYDFYDRFSKAKGLPALNRKVLEQMASLGRFALSYAQEGDGAPLVFHAYFVYRQRARALYSASLRLQEEAPARLKLISRANRLLHWEDIRWFRTDGQTTYDFGGWYSGTEDAARLAINQFKHGFGGTTITEYEAIHGVTLMGKLGVLARKLLKKDA